MALRKHNEARINPVRIARRRADNGRNFHTSILAEARSGFPEKNDSSGKKIPRGI